MAMMHRYAKVLKAIKVESERGLKTKESARAMLMKEGVYTKRGALKVAFGGKPDKKSASAS